MKVTICKSSKLQAFASRYIKYLYSTIEPTERFLILWNEFSFKDRSPALFLLHNYFLFIIYKTDVFPLCVVRKVFVCARVRSSRNQLGGSPCKSTTKKFFMIWYDIIFNRTKLKCVSIIQNTGEMLVLYKKFLFCIIGECLPPASALM